MHLSQVNILFKVHFKKQWISLTALMQNLCVKSEKKNCHEQVMILNLWDKRVTLKLNAHTILKWNVILIFGI